jgi:hypothetical protein
LRRPRAGFIAVISRGGKMNPLPFGRKKLAGTIDHVLEQVDKATREVFSG